MAITFITGSAGKMREVRSVIPEIEQLDIDLPEIQEIDPKKIIEAKLLEAAKHHQGELIVEDTSLSLDCLNGLPGPLIKWFLAAIGKEGLADLAEKMGNAKASARTIVGYLHEGTIQYFEGICPGLIVKPRGENGFGWDQIFQPDGSGKTFGEMELAEKERFSMRKAAVEKLKQFLG